MTRKLLIADDAMIIREIVKDVAQGAGWEIAGEACNGQEAVDLYRQLRPDALTLDLVMPERGGLDALREIMEIDPQAKVLVVSALDQRDSLKAAFKGGASDFISKPFSAENLVASLDRMAPVPANA